MNFNRSGLKFLAAHYVALARAAKLCHGKQWPSRGSTKVGVVNYLRSYSKVDKKPPLPVSLRRKRRQISGKICKDYKIRLVW